MNDRPNPVSKQYIKSEAAAPMPVEKPAQRPLLSVRWIHNMPMGPIGAEIRTPIRNPLVIMSIKLSIISK